MPRPEGRKDVAHVEQERTAVCCGCGKQMKKNRLFRLTDKEIEAVTKACISAMNKENQATLQRAVDKIAKSQWYSDTQTFSPDEIAQKNNEPTHH